MITSLIVGVVIMAVMIWVATLVRGDIDVVTSRKEHIPAVVAGVSAAFVMLLSKYGWIENAFLHSVAKTVPIMVLIVALAVFFWNMTSTMEEINRSSRSSRHDDRYDDRGRHSNRESRNDSRHDVEETHYDWEEIHYDWEDPNWKG